MKALIAILVILLAVSAVAEPKDGSGGISFSLSGVVIALIFIIAGAVLLGSRYVIFQLLGIILLLIGLVNLVTAIL